MPRELSAEHIKTPDITGQVLAAMFLLADSGSD
jgi:hypothetical protein